MYLQSTLDRNNLDVNDLINSDNDLYGGVEHTTHSTFNIQLSYKTDSNAEDMIRTIIIMCKCIN